MFILVLLVLLIVCIFYIISMLLLFLAKWAKNFIVLVNFFKIKVLNFLSVLITKFWKK